MGKSTPVRNEKARFRAFSDAIRDRRRDVGLSQEKLAEKAKLDRTYVGGIERGERNPNAKHDSATQADTARSNSLFGGDGPMMGQSCSNRRSRCLSRWVETLAYPTSAAIGTQLSQADVFCLSTVQTTGRLAGTRPQTDVETIAQSTEANQSGLSVKAGLRPCSVGFVEPNSCAQHDRKAVPPGRIGPRPQISRPNLQRNIYTPNKRASPQIGETLVFPPFLAVRPTGFEPVTSCSGAVSQ
jgi:DNA-binding XRE family transcriptional regulator